MGEEAKQEEKKPEEVPKAEEEKKDEKALPEEEKAVPPPPAPEEKEEPKPPSPFVLSVDLHCTGCAKKIQRSIMKIRGVEEVVIDMVKNQLSIKGVVEPEAVCTKIMKKAKRPARVLSLPLPQAEGEPTPQVVASQVSGLTTVELNVNMHCEACAEQLKKKILKMRGVRTAETDASLGKVTVTGTMDGDKLVDYVYRRTKKQAKIVPRPEPEKPPAEEPPKPTEEPPKLEEKKEEGGEEKKEGEEQQPPPPPPPEGENNNNKEEQSGENKEVLENNNNNNDNNNNTMMMMSEDQMIMQRPMVNYHHHHPPYPYQPFYVIERIPPPQLFSDENPNACCIT